VNYIPKLFFGQIQIGESIHVNSSTWIVKILTRFTLLDSDSWIQGCGSKKMDC